MGEIFVGMYNLIQLSEGMWTFRRLRCLTAHSRDSGRLCRAKAEGSLRAQWGNRGTVTLGNKEQERDVFGSFEAEAGTERHACGDLPAGVLGRNAMGEGRKFFSIPSDFLGGQHGAPPSADALPAPERGV